MPVVGRCVDLPELLSVAATGTARAVLLSTDLEQLDRDAVGRLAAAGVATIGLAGVGDDHAQTVLRRIGVPRVLRADVGAAEVARVVIEAVAEGLAAPESWFGDPAAALPVLPPPVRVPAPARGRGRGARGVGTDRRAGAHGGGDRGRRRGSPARRRDAARRR